MNIPKQKEQEEEKIYEAQSKQEQDQPIQQTSSALVYGESPIQMQCPFCLQHIHSEIILKPQFISIALGISVFSIVPHLSMMILVILLMHLTASRKHRCPLCQRELGSDGRFLIFSLFSAGFIFTKKTSITIILLIFAFIALSFRVSIINAERMINISWLEYSQNCLANPLVCIQKYHGKQFLNWEAHLLRLQDARQSPRKYYSHAIRLYVKMQPEKKRDSNPDVLLTLSSDNIQQNSNVLSQLQHGDLIRFNCSMHDRYRGNIKDAMHFHIENMQIIGHDQEYALFTTEIQEQWIQVHLQDKNALTSQPDKI